MPRSISSSRTRGVWASHPKASTPKRWNRVVSPPVQSRWCRLTASMPGRGQRGGPPLGPLLDAARGGSSRRGGRPAQRPRHSATCSQSGWHSHRLLERRRPRRPGPRRSPGRRRHGSLTSSDTRDVGAARGVQVGERGDVRRAGRRGRRWRWPRRRRRPPAMPSWSRTASPSAVSHTSLSRPVAPRRRASANASSVFSGAWRSRSAVGERVGWCDQCWDPRGHGRSSPPTKIFRRTPSSWRVATLSSGRADRGERWPP